MNDNTEIISSLKSINDNDYSTVKKVLLVGEAVFASFDAITPSGMVMQANRESKTGLLSSFSKEKPQVHVSISELLFDLRKTRFALAFDGYLEWGMHQEGKTPLILLGGAETQTGVHVEIMLFENGTLTELREKILPETASSYFKDALNSMISDLRERFPTARMVLAAPLANWEVEGVDYVGEKPLSKLTYRPLSRSLNKRGSLKIPVALAAISFIIYPLMAMTGWTAYTEAVENYTTAMKDPAVINSKNGMDTDYLENMNSRRIYMEQPRRQEELIEKSTQIVNGIATVANIKIIAIKLPAPGISPQNKAGIIVSPDAKKDKTKLDKDRPADVWLSIASQKTNDVAIVQAKELMTQIANKTGMSLRLTHDGWRDDSMRRIFNIEGFIHD